MHRGKLGLITITLGLILTVGAAVGTTATAAINNRKANIQSQGNIDAQINNQRIYISSSDLRYLADEIDLLEDTYKINTVDALNSIGTFFRLDGTAVYDAGLNEADTAEEKTALTFKSLKTAIEGSQSVASLGQTQATDRNGTLLFYKDKAASDSKNLMNTTMVDTGYPVYYQAATSENLSAGTAAWVNGILIKGKGTDNTAYYSQGVAAGESKSKVGTATADKVLSGYTFTNSTGVGIAGTMADRGVLNWNPTSSTTLTIQPGYYNGGTLNSAGAYNAGVSFADGRVNTGSASYQDGYEQGKKSIKKVLIGTGGNGTYSVVGRVDNYGQLTADNFIFVAKTVFVTGNYYNSTGSNWAGAQTIPSASASVALDYNPLTGEVTVSNCNISSSHVKEAGVNANVEGGITGDIYCYY